MIWESRYWKDDLLRRARDLKGRRAQRRWPEASLAKLEQSLMVGFYSVRKLIEARKLSDSLVAREISVTLYPSVPGARITLLNWHKLDRHYDFDAPEQGSLRLDLLCHQFVHSYVFTPVFSEVGELDSFLFASDWERKKRLHSIELGTIVDLFTDVGKDYPSSVNLVWNENKGDYDVISS